MTRDACVFAIFLPCATTCGTYYILVTSNHEIYLGRDVENLMIMHHYYRYSFGDPTTNDFLFFSVIAIIHRGPLRAL